MLSVREYLTLTNLFIANGFFKQPGSYANNFVQSIASGDISNLFGDSNKLLAEALKIAESFIVENDNIKALADALGKSTLPAYLGARICYSKYDAYDIYKQEVWFKSESKRKKKPAQQVEFVLNLAVKNGHTSIFGLSQVYHVIPLAVVPANIIAELILYQGVYIPEKAIKTLASNGLLWFVYNSRTFAEYANATYKLLQKYASKDDSEVFFERLKLFARQSYEAQILHNQRLATDIDYVFPKKVKLTAVNLFEAGSEIRTKLERLYNETSEQYKSLLPKIEAYLLNSEITNIVDVEPAIKQIPTTFRNIEDESNLITYSVFIEGVDRVSTHQIVRHSTLNFTQRSNRYKLVKPKDFVISLADLLDLLKKTDDIEKLNQALAAEYEHIFESFNRYQHKLNSGIPKEDARAELKQYQRSALWVSGHKKNLDKFIAERIKQDAQWNTRLVAQALNLLLKT